MLTKYVEEQVPMDETIVGALYALAKIVKPYGYRTFEPIIVNGELAHVFVDGELYTPRPTMWDVLHEKED